MGIAEKYQEMVNYIRKAECIEMDILYLNDKKNIVSKKIKKELLSIVIIKTKKLMENLIKDMKKTKIWKCQCPDCGSIITVKENPLINKEVYISYEDLHINKNIKKENHQKPSKNRRTI